MIRGWQAVYMREMLILRRRLAKLIMTWSVSPVLYLIAFGYAMGQGITVQEHSYLEFLIPGLAGMANPFLHMGLHIAVIEALQTDRPPGVRAAYQALVGRTGDAHAAEHRMMERLAEELWHAGQEGRPPDAVAWLQALGAVRA